MGKNMRKSTKVISFIRAYLSILGLTACSGTPAPFKVQNSVTVQTSQATALAEKNTLMVWHQWTTDDTNARAFKKVVTDYQALHPDIEIQFDVAETEAYKTKVKTAACVNELPDVFFYWGGGAISPFVDAGAIMPLDSYLDDVYRANIICGTLDNFIFYGKTYGLTTSQWVGALYCNKEMFDLYNVKIPVTFDDLLTAIEVFNTNNIIPVSVGGKDGWPAMFFQNIMAVRTAGAAQCNQMLSGASSFNSPEMVKSAQYVLDLVEAGAFGSSVLAHTYDEARISFEAGKNPMLYTGDWIVSEIQDPSSKLKDKVVAVNFPGINDGQDNSQILGGAIDGFCVSNNAKDKDLAVEFIKYITQNMSEQCFAEGGQPTRKFDMSKYTVDPLAQQITDYAAKSTGSVLAWDTFLSGQAAETHKRLCQRLFAGEITAETFALEMAKLQK